MSIRNSHRAMSGATADDPPVGDDLHERPVELLRQLVRFDTTNPPGDERACVEWIADVLDAYGVASETFAAEPDRPNLLARYPGGDGPALMLYGHVDVVPTTGQEWTHPPFAGVVEDDFVWGRGTLDMKGGVAMLLAGFLRTVHEERELPGDLVLCVVSDEEGGGDVGAAYLVEEHAEQFADVEYALGEFGGFSMALGGERFYPIQVNEKQICWLQATFTGPAGHGSLPHHGGAMAKLGAALAALDGTRLPVRVTPPVEAMVSAIADELPAPVDEQLAALLDPDRTDAVLDELGEDGAMFDALLHNTVNPTIVRGGDKENVVPGTVELTLDARLVPGSEPDDVIDELRAVVGDDVEFEVVRYEPGPPAADMALFDTLAGVLRDADPAGRPVPLLLSGGSDGRHFARLGIQSYGFTPMRLPEDFAFMDLLHAADERIPVEAVEFGADAVTEAVRRYEGEGGTADS